MTVEDLQRLFTHDARDAYRFFSRGIDRQGLDALPWHRRLPAHFRLLFLGFTLKLSPARRIMYGVALVAAALGLLELFTGFGWLRLPAGIVVLPIVVPRWEDGTVLLLIGFVLVNLLVLLEVADRLSLKNDLEIAREIQLAMLPHLTHRVRASRRMARRSRPTRSAATSTRSSRSTMGASSSPSATWRARGARPRS